MAEKVIISCITPTFNRAHLIGSAIQSTIKQTFPYWELIIVDDGSTDNTESLVHSYICKDKRVKYFRNPKKGGAAARNFGIKQVRGEYIAFLDDDDISLPHRFESQLYAAKNSGSSFVVSGYEVRDRNTDKLKTKVKLALKGMGVGFPSRWLIKKELLEKVNGFDEDFPSMQDIELSYRLGIEETFILHDDIVSVIYPTINSVSKRPENSLAGKELLMQKLGSKMHPMEAAIWYYTIGLGHYSLDRLRVAKHYFKLASAKNGSIAFRLGYYFFNITKSFPGRLKKLNLKILHFIGNCYFPVIVKHKVITPK